MPYFGLRSYTDGGAHYGGQIGSEATPAEYLDALWACTAEWCRVLRPGGSMFINLGDKYVADNRGSGFDVKRGQAKHAPAGPLGYLGRDMARHKSLLGIPWRYAIGCCDRLGLILRAEIIWSKPNGLPESVTDRVRRAHEQVFHFTRQPRYYAAVDEIREPHLHPNHHQLGKNTLGAKWTGGGDHTRWHSEEKSLSPLGKLPGSVWSIPSAPLTVPAHLGVDHFAAFPPALVRPLILGWSPPGVCTACGEGRRPVAVTENTLTQATNSHAKWSTAEIAERNGRHRKPLRTVSQTAITGYACACPEPSAPARPAVVLDPFAGTGTTMLVASAYGRIGIGVDRSADYCRLAAWRVRDPGERARARDLPKPPPVPEGMEPLFAMEGLW